MILAKNWQSYRYFRESKLNLLDVNILTILCTFYNALELKLGVNIFYSFCGGIKVKTLLESQDIYLTLLKKSQS